MMVDVMIVFINFNSSQDQNKNERNELDSDEPYINHSYVGHGRKLVHHTDSALIFTFACCMYRKGRPYEKSCCHQHHSQVDRNSCLKIELLEESCSIADPNEKERWKIGCQQLIGEDSFESDLHFYAIVRIFLVIEKELPRFYFVLGKLQRRLHENFIRNQ